MFAARVLKDGARIVIPAKRKVNALKLAELVGHEIDAHYRNSRNDEIIGCVKTDDETIYEGVAKTKDMAFQKKVYGRAVLPSPFYIIAMAMAMEGSSFAKVGELMYSFTKDAEKAWTYTYRTFRGISDCRNIAGYAFTKDKAYLEGVLLVEDMKASGLKEYLNFGLSVKDMKDLIKITDGKLELDDDILRDKNTQDKVK